MAPLGNLVRLLPLQLQEIPFHTDLETSRKQGLEETNQDIATTESPNNLLEHDGRPQVVPFVKEVLNEAIQFINDTVPSTFKEGNVTLSKPSAAEVRLLSRNISKTELIEIPWSTSRIARQSPVEILRAGEAWFARRSHHENCRKEGTADFAQLDWGLRVNHSEHEQEYTPDVFDSYKVLDWDMETEDDELSVDGYSHISMKVYEMCHKLPFPLSPRVFPVLVITARTGPESFVIVQIPVDLTKLPKAFYSNGRNIKEGNSELKRKKPTLGVYTSIEQCKVVEGQKIEWTMATASDAKGSLPLWMQKQGVPGAIAKDVGLFMKWASENRNSG